MRAGNASLGRLHYRETSRGRRTKDPYAIGLITLGSLFWLMTPPVECRHQTNILSYTPFNL